MTKPIEQLLSVDRLDGYKGKSRNELEIKLRRYNFNIELCKTFYPLLHLLEVSLRNTLHHPLLKTREREKIQDALVELKKMGSIRLKLTIKNEDQLSDFLNKNTPKIDTDYFVDVHMTKPFTYHGTGLGMWGGLLSTVTLGILPAWWTHETEFKAYVYKQSKSVEQLNFKNDYNSFSSTLFYFVPENETFINSGNRLMIPHKNEINYIIQNVTEKLCQH